MNKIEDNKIESPAKPEKLMLPFKVQHLLDAIIVKRGLGIFIILLSLSFIAAEVASQNQNRPYVQNDPSTHNYTYDKAGFPISDKQQEIEEFVWDSRGKLKAIRRTPHSSKPDLFFEYDAFGNRMSQTEVYPHSINGINKLTTYYIYDPFGKVMSVYERRYYDTGKEEYAQIEQHIYNGNTRIGVKTMNLILATNEGVVEHDLSKSERVLGEKKYELTNHLGNVVAVVSDKKLPDNEPDVVAVADYFPYGMPMPGRYFSREDYRFGFQGQEKIPQLNSSHTTALHWEYDGRIGRRWNIDPKFNLIPQWSPYAVLGNNPVINIDKQGDIWDVFLDAAFILYDVGEIGYDYFTKGEVDPISVAALSADVGMLFVPVGTGGGLAVRASAKTVEATQKTTQALRVGNRAFQSTTQAAKYQNYFTKYGDKVADAIWDSGRGGANKLATALGTKGTGKIAHHLIPVQLVDELPVVREAIEQGFDFNGKINGIALDATRHSGSHGDYTNMVNRMIKGAEETMKGKTPKEILEYVAKETETIIKSTTGKINDIAK